MDEADHSSLTEKDVDFRRVFLVVIVDTTIMHR